MLPSPCNDLGLHYMSVGCSINTQLLAVAPAGDDHPSVLLGIPSGGHMRVLILGYDPTS